jgi:hypothetical protein
MSAWSPLPYLPLSFPFFSILVELLLLLLVLLQLAPCNTPMASLFSTSERIEGTFQSLGRCH